MCPSARKCMQSVIAEKVHVICKVHATAIAELHAVACNQVHAIYVCMFRVQRALSLSAVSTLSDTLNMHSTLTPRLAQFYSAPCTIKPIETKQIF